MRDDHPVWRVHPTIQCRLDADAPIRHSDSDERRVDDCQGRWGEMELWSLVKQVEEGTIQPYHTVYDVALP